MTSSANDWQHQAACASHDPELFFPIGRAGPAPAQLERARQICRTCPVQGPCLDWAITVGADDGVWGGLDELERRSMRRRQRPGRSRASEGRRSTPDALLAVQTASRQRTTNAAAALSPGVQTTDPARTSS